jgi:hypothetical protein
MPTVTIRNEHKAYLDRVSRQMSEKLGRRVSPTEILHEVLDLCIRDEAVYEPKTSAPIKPETRDIYVSERSARSQPLDLTTLLSRIRLGD